MRLADVERFVGIPYSQDSFDCADLVMLVQRELFGRDIVLPNGRPRGVRGALQLGDLSRQYAVPADEPMDGDLVLMLERGRPAHVGTYFHLAHEGWVLHTCERTTVSVLHRVLDLPAWGAPNLVMLVQRELFGRDIVLPNGRPRGVRGALQLGDLSRQYAVPVDEPRDGDLVLMLEGGRPAHVGTYFYLDHEGWVLHTCERTTVSVLHRVRDLPAWGAPVEGYYRWV